MPATTRATVRARTYVGWILLAGSMLACSDGGTPGTPSTPGASSPAGGGLKGALTQPAPSDQRTSVALRLGFDCNAVRAAQARLDAAIDEALQRSGASANSPQGFDLTVVVTAAQAEAFWRQAVAVLPADLHDQGEQVRQHWSRLATSVAAAAREVGVSPDLGVAAVSPSSEPADDAGSTPSPEARTTTPATVSAARLHAARRAVEELARRNGGAAVAQDERALRARIARACP